MKRFNKAYSGSVRRVLFALLILLPIALQAWAENINHTYDELNRLIRSDYANGTVVEYSYDAAGNRLTHQVSTNQPIAVINIQAPNGGEVWNQGSKQTIRWLAPSITRKKLMLVYLSINNGLNWKVIATVKNTGATKWTIPLKRYVSQQALIKICLKQKIPLCETSNATFTINQAPVAEAGTKQTVMLGTEVVLNGAASRDADNGPSALTYNWVKKRGPAVTLNEANTVTPRFTPTVKGTYLFGLVVNDGSANSKQDLVTVKVKATPK